MVVEQALGDVQDPLARQADPLERDLEVRVVRLVAPACWAVMTQSNVTPEPPLDAAKRSSSQLVMTAELEALLESGEGGRRIREGRPVHDGAAERAALAQRARTPSFAATPRRPPASTSR